MAILIISFKKNIPTGTLLLLLLILSSCASTGQFNDPLEPFNRKVQAFNDSVDTYGLKPLAKGYAFLFPEFFRKGIQNAFDNIAYPAVFINQFLQGKGEAGFLDMSRFIFNSTIGLAGLFDVATGMGLPAHNEDFGQTFAVWGVGSGPYLVLPILGPVTMRRGIGMVPGFFTYLPTYIDDDTVRWSIYGTVILVERERWLKKEKLIVGDRYSFIRDAYLQRRQYLINDGLSEEDPFLTD